MPDYIQLRGIRFLAFCGTLEHEQQTRQGFEIDLDVEADQSRAGQTDNLSDAVDYGPLCDVVTKIADTERFGLMERMAQRIVDELFVADTKINAIKITVKKLNPPVGVDINTAGVSIYRTR